MKKRYETFDEFWPFYLSEHSNPVSRRLHIAGSSFAVVLLITILVSQKIALIPLALVFGYGFAWIGHFGFEKNKPASFKYPLWSLRGDFKMLGLFYSGKLNQELKRLSL